MFQLGMRRRMAIFKTQDAVGKRDITLVLNFRGQTVSGFPDMVKMPFK
jgi:hypothetical protein